MPSIFIPLTHYNRVLDQRIVPKDPLAFIQSCVRRKQIRWTYHATMRFRQRVIGFEAVLDSVDSYEVIEEYSEDKYLPSYLIRAGQEGSIFHIHAAADLEGDNVRIVTAYVPNPQEWDTELRTRRMVE